MNIITPNGLLNTIAFIVFKLFKIQGFFCKKDWQNCVRFTFIRSNGTKFRSCERELSTKIVCSLLLVSSLLNSKCESYHSSNRLTSFVWNIIHQAMIFVIRKRPHFTNYSEPLIFNNVTVFFRLLRGCER